MLLKNEFKMEIMKKDNDDVSLASLNEQIKTKACLYFKGCTLISGSGYWFDGKLYSDENYTLIINFNRDDKNSNVLYELLDLIKMELIGGSQETVYFAVDGITSISGNMEEARHDLVEMLKK